MKRVAVALLLGLAATPVAGAGTPALPPAPPVATPPAQVVATAAPRGSWAVQVLVDTSRVTVRVPEAYAQTPETTAAFSRWGAFLGTLLHGAELDGVTLAFSFPPDMKRTCGGGALACYDPSSRTLHVPPEAPVGWPLEHVVAHEYAHHIAASRDNSPWSAFTWGTKRWATAVHVCQQVYAVAADPFGEDWFSTPGEAFAETYRVLNARRSQSWGASPPWAMGPGFPLSAAALRAVELDVLQPWSPSLTATVRAMVRHGVARVTVPTPLDGTVRLRLRGASRGAYVRVPEADPSVAVSPVVDATVCGERTLEVEVAGARDGRVKLEVLA